MNNEPTEMDNWKNIKITKDGETHTIETLILMLEHENKELRARGTVATTPTNDGGPAYPTSNITKDDGISLRDWLAGQALAGITSVPTKFSSIVIARQCYLLADAMLEARTIKPE